MSLKILLELKLVRNKKCQLVVLSCGYSNFHNDAGRYFLKSLVDFIFIDYS